MRRSQHTDQEIVHLLSEAVSGVPVAEICRTAHVSLRTFYRWRQRFGGLTPPAVKHMQELEAENRRLRALVTKLTASLRDASVTDGAQSRRSFPTRSEIGGEDVGSALSGGSPGMTLGRFAALRVCR